MSKSMFDHILVLKAIRFGRVGDCILVLVSSMPVLQIRDRDWNSSNLPKISELLS